jgi:hypothetical protein
LSDNSSQQGADTIATDDVGGVKYQRVKVTYGADGFATDVSSSNPLPVDSELTTADLDTGAGTDTRAVVGLARAESGGAVLVGSGNPLPVTVSTAPVRARTTDSIASAVQTDAVMNGLTALTPKFAKIAASSSGATTVVSAVTSKKLRILGFVFVADGAVDVNFRSHTTTATATGVFYTAANGGASVPFSPVGWFETASGEALDINLGGAVAVGGQLVYVEV